MSKTLNENPIEQCFFKRIGRHPSSIAYVPSKTDTTRKYFEKIKDHFIAIGVPEVSYCDFDMEYSHLSLNKLQKAECIYLSGGFTPYFLEQLQKHDLLANLTYRAQEGCPIIGVSAGALIMSKSIDILIDDPLEGKATQGMADRKGLGLFDFEFWPHYGRNVGDESRLRQRNTSTGIKIIGCDDQSGFMRTGNEWSVYGATTIFDNKEMK